MSAAPAPAAAAAAFFASEAAPFVDGRSQ